MKVMRYVGAGFCAGALGGVHNRMAGEIRCGRCLVACRLAIEDKRQERNGARRVLCLQPGSHLRIFLKGGRKWTTTKMAKKSARREALLAGLGPAEFPALLAEMDDMAGLSGLDNPGENQLRLLFKAWHAKAPDAALTWLNALPKSEDRR